MKAAGIPLYLRFDLVKLSYINMALYEGTIDERFEWDQMILQPFKQALTGSKFEFLGTISNDKKVFKDSSSLLNQIDKLLSIFTLCRVYKFYIESHINKNTSAHVLSEILQFDAIVRCSKIRVELNFEDPMQTRLPIEAIENWLNRTNADGEKCDERFLKLKISYDVSNLSEMFEYLKKV